jgi:hypothetical protein
MARKRKSTRKSGYRSKKNIGTQGSEIMKIAKRIRRDNPRKKWTTCVKEAGKEWKKRH